MADKEATAFVIDVGRSMGDKHHGRDISDLDWSMQYVWDKITAMVATGRKTLHGAVIGLRTDETSNELQSDDGYQNIAVWQEMGQIMMPQIRSLQGKIKPSQSKHGDAISAIVVAMQMIAGFCKKLKFKKRIILVTNGDMLMELDADAIQEIGKKLQEESIELTILGVDFDSESYEFYEKNKPHTKRENEVALQQLAELSNGVIGTLKEAVEELDVPRIKTVRPTPTYKGKLRLGDSSSFDSAMEIDVERYPRTMLAAAPSASRYVAKSQDEMEVDKNDAGEEQSEDKQTGFVPQNRMYQVKDESAPDGKKDVDRDDLAKGYSYGNSAVYIEQSDENVTKLETKAGLDIVGFVPKEGFEHYMAMSRSSMIVAQRTNELAMLALSAFIHTLFELDTYAIGRLVTKEMRPPVLVLLAAEITMEHDCLIDVELPFAEDFRQHKFPPLDRIITISGKVHTEHRNLPTKELKSAMNAFVDSMDLTAEKDEEDNVMDLVPLDENFSPKLHRINQLVQYRTVHPDAAVPAMPEALTRFSRPPPQLLSAATSHLEALTAAANVKKVPPRAKARGRGFRREAEQPRSGLDVQALLNSERPATNGLQISAANAIPEFRQALDNPANHDVLPAAVAQLGAIVRTWIAESTGDAGYARAAEAVGAMKVQCVELEEPGLYNAFLEELKTDLFAERLGGDRREMWYALRAARLGPITRGVAEQSSYDEDTARTFMIPDRTRSVV